MSPEVLKGEPYGHEIDVFPLAIIAYILLSGDRPFLMPSKDVIGQDKNLVSLNRLRYADWQWSQGLFSPLAKDFIEAAGAEFPDRRPTVEDLLKHSFITRQVTLCKGPALNSVRGAYSQSTTDGTGLSENKAIFPQKSTLELESKSDWIKELKEENRRLKFELKLRMNPTSIDFEDEDLFPVDPRDGYSPLAAFKHIFEVSMYARLIQFL